MTDEAELLQRLRNREKNSIDEAIQIYTPYLSTVLYHMAGNSLPKEDIVISCCCCPEFCSETDKQKNGSYIS